MSSKSNYLVRLVRESPASKSDPSAVSLPDPLYSRLLDLAKSPQPRFAVYNTPPAPVPGLAQTLVCASADLSFSDGNLFVSGANYSFKSSAVRLLGVDDRTGVETLASVSISTLALDLMPTGAVLAFTRGSLDVIQTAIVVVYPDGSFNLDSSKFFDLNTTQPIPTSDLANHLGFNPSLVRLSASAALAAILRVSLGDPTTFISDPSRFVESIE
ncbi:hypothetical protein HY990_01195 [Candidatus Micrarchaeota archaeon]|nr:hypothetical protein [Candidatus Micrarchaeota archaeon]